MKFIGLTEAEVEKKRLKFGTNILPEERIASGLRIFLSQFANPLVYILLAVNVISLLQQEYTDAIIIFFTVLLNSVFGFSQEYRTQKTMAALKRIVVPTAKVIRDGVRQEIQAISLVPGDIVVLMTGDRVPADGKILESSSFFVNEAIMTGESESVERRADNEVMMGTVISWGTATIEIVRTGLNTKLGEIASSIKKTEQPPTTLQIRLKKYVRWLIVAGVILCVVLFVVGLMRGLEFWMLLRMTSILLMAMMPEALLMAVTLILVIAMRKILKRKALIRKLLAVETLGSVTTICTDKTGTLTEGEMRVTKVELPDRVRGLEAMCLCNNIADSTEIALWEYLVNQKDFEPEILSNKQTRVQEIPFGSDHKFMATVNCLTPNTDCTLYVKGAPEVVLAMTNLHRKEKDAILAQVESWAKEGLRVLALAYYPMHGAPASININSLPSLNYAGLVGLWDPPRPEVREALMSARQAGIKIKVVTGDYVHTALKIMENLGLEVGPNGVLDGLTLEGLDDDGLRRRIMSTMLFARVTPKQKLRIVTALQELGEIVTMTGDGVNDAPALKRANIGIVVGTATEVAKETAEVILLDSNFKTIVAAVEEGRVVFENIRKAVFYMLADSFAEVLIVISSILLGWPLPLTIAQIVWIHLICDGPQDIMLGLEPKEKEVLAEGPKRIDEHILDAPRLFLILVISLLNSASAMLLFWYFALHQGNIELGRTMAFTLLTLETILFIFPSRSFRKPFWRYENFWKNPWLLFVVGVNLILQIAVTNVPFTRELFGLSTLNAMHWTLQFLIAGAGLVIIELVKWGQNKFTNSRKNNSASIA